MRVYPRRAGQTPTGPPRGRRADHSGEACPAPEVKKGGLEPDAQPRKSSVFLANKRRIAIVVRAHAAAGAGRSACTSIGDTGLATPVRGHFAMQARSLPFLHACRCPSFSRRTIRARNISPLASITSGPASWQASVSERAYRDPRVAGQSCPVASAPAEHSRFVRSPDRAG
jgi:hypothetical protein